MLEITGYEVAIGASGFILYLWVFKYLGKKIRLRERAKRQEGVRTMDTS
jgi:hypothetical protein